MMALACELGAAVGAGRVDAPDGAAAWPFDVCRACDEVFPVDLLRVRWCLACDPCGPA